MKKALIVLILALVFVLSFTLCISAAEENDSTDTKGDIILGDVNGDGEVTNADVLAIYRYIYNPELFPLPTLCYHDFGEWSVELEPGCEEQGLKTRTCIKCGAVDEKVIEATGAHTEVVDEEVKPTCTEKGLTEGKHCSACGKVLIAQTEIEVLGHTPSGVIIDTFATCTSDGTYHIECRRCKEVLSTGVVESQGHSYDATVVPPTKADKGYTKHTCKNCGDIYMDTYVPEIGSVGLEFTPNGEGTCYVSGIGTCTDAEIVIPSVSPDGDSVTGIGSKAFYRSTLPTSIKIPDSVTSIGALAFGYCTSLTSIEIPDSVTSIGSDLFYNCASLTSVTIGDGVTSIGDLVFFGCTSLTSITIGADVTSIGSNAFYNCTSLTSIELPNSVTSIGEYAFEHCTSLKDVHYTGTKEQWQRISINSNGNSSLTNATIHYDHPAIDSIGLEFTSNGDGTCYVSGIGTCIDTEIVIPSVSPEGDSVTGIGTKAFYRSTLPTSIKIPDSVTSIGSSAFSYCTSLTSIDIPDSVTSIGSDLFYNCASLMSVTIGTGVTSIGDLVFSGCTSLTSITIGDGVTSIGGNAFYNCNSLTGIVIPNSVTSIGNYAFEHCTSLKNVYYTGTQEQWQRISINSNGNSSLTNATIHYNYIAA